MPVAIKLEPHQEKTVYPEVEQWASENFHLVDSVDLFKGRLTITTRSIIHDRETLDLMIEDGILDPTEIDYEIE
jgi:hypothetical protein